MSIKNTNGTINWKDNDHLIYILFSIMKHYMIKNNLTNYPCQVNDNGVIECAKIMSIVTGEEITPGQVGGQLWIQTDTPGISTAKFRNIKIAIEVGLISESNFNDVIIEPISRVERKNHIIKEEEKLND